MRIEKEREVWELGRGESGDQAKSRGGSRRSGRIESQRSRELI